MLEHSLNNLRKHQIHMVDFLNSMHYHRAVSLISLLSKLQMSCLNH